MSNKETKLLSKALEVRTTNVLRQEKEAQKKNLEILSALMSRRRKNANEEQKTLK
jgi:hypothetical protein